MTDALPGEELPAGTPPRTLAAGAVRSTPRCALPRELALAALAALLPMFGACVGEAPPAPNAPPALGPVARTRSAALRTAAPAPAIPPPVEEGSEATRAMLETRVHGGQFRDLVFEDLEALGDGAIVPLSAHALDPRLGADLRAAAVELLGALGTPAAAERLLGLATDSPEAWLRAHAAWRLAACGSDHVVPGLVLRLKYERDPDAFLWVASTLGRLGCLAGLGGLLELAAREDARAALAAAEVAAVVEPLGMEAEQALTLWSGVEAEALPLPPPSDAQLREVWDLVLDLSGDTFQLRPVDDARYVLSRLGPWCAREVASALVDEDPWLRLHCAQVLETMGPRARGVEGQLLHALAEPGVAPAAAEALGRVGGPQAMGALLECTGPGRPHELRVGAVRALGTLGLPEAAAPVRALFEGLAAPADPQDLRMAAATALVGLGEGDAAAPWLTERLGGAADASEAEVALGAWLRAGAAATRVGFQAALRSWDRHADPPGALPNTDRAIARRRARAASLEGQLPELIGS